MWRAFLASGLIQPVHRHPSRSSQKQVRVCRGQSTVASIPTYPVVVRVPNALPALASGSRAEASLLIGTVTGVLTVPSSALTPLGNGQALVLTFKGGVVTRALVKTGRYGAGWRWVRGRRLRRWHLHWPVGFHPGGVETNAWANRAPGCQESRTGAQATAPIPRKPRPARMGSRAGFLHEFRRAPPS